MFVTADWWAVLSIQLFLPVSLNYRLAYVQMNRINFLGFPYLDDWANIKRTTDQIAMKDDMTF